MTVPLELMKQINAKVPKPGATKPPEPKFDPPVPEPKEAAKEPPKT